MSYNILERANLFRFPKEFNCVINEHAVLLISYAFNMRREFSVRTYFSWFKNISKQKKTFLNDNDKQAQ